MIILIISLCLVVGGMLASRLYLEATLRKRIIQVLESTNIILLYLLIIFVFSLKAPSVQSLPLVALGILIQLIPSIIGLILYKYNKRSAGINIIFFSTYGGGNRGILLLTLFFPYLIDSFVLIDLGNFLSLIVFFPIISRQINNEPFNTNNVKHLVYIISAISLGFYINLIDMNIDFLHVAKDIIGISLITFLSIYIGLSSKTRINDVMRVIPIMFMARFFSLFVPLYLFILIMPNGVINKLDAIMILCVFSILPISSLAQHYINHRKTKELLIDHTISTSFLFILLLLFIEVYHLIAVLIKT